MHMTKAEGQQNLLWLTPEDFEDLRKQTVLMRMADVVPRGVSDVRLHMGDAEAFAELALHHTGYRLLPAEPAPFLPTQAERWGTGLGDNPLKRAILEAVQKYGLPELPFRVLAQDNVNDHGEWWAAPSMFGVYHAHGKYPKDGDTTTPVLWAAYRTTSDNAHPEWPSARYVYLDKSSAIALCQYDYDMRLRACLSMDEFPRLPKVLRVGDDIPNDTGVNCIDPTC
jgi:hypothetical protein